MRLDKFLKVTRLVKRRTIANAMCDAGQVYLNGKTAKASTEVAVGQTITLRLGSRIQQVQILNIPASATIQTPADYYQILTTDP